MGRIEVLKLKRSCEGYKIKRMSYVEPTGAIRTVGTGSDSNPAEGWVFAFLFILPMAGSRTRNMLASWEVGFDQTTPALAILDQIGRAHV